MIQEEKHAIRVRECADRLAAAHKGVAEAEADLKRTFARTMLASGEKSAAAQERYADEDESVYLKRVHLGVAQGELAAARAELKAIEISFETWRTRMANARIEQRAYGQR